MSFWIFKCDPTRYRLEERIRDLNPNITWLVTRYKNEIKSGDTVFLMETGKNRMIRAVMRITENPQQLPELPGEQRYWAEPDTQTRLRVIGEISHRLELPIDDLLQVPELRDLSIFIGVQQGTNFRVSEEEGQVILQQVQSHMN